jgi:DNA-binding response OmpR family regulator
MKKILIVDDDKIFSKVLRDGLVLKNNGDCEVINAYDGEDGLEKAKKEKPDLIVLDLMMPKIGGLEFLKKMRINKDLSGIPVLVSSQSSDVEKISEGLELGIKGYIVKTDYSLDSVIGQIRDILDKK